MTDRPVAVFCTDENGTPHYVASAGVDFYIVEDHCPNDRVYRMDDKGLSPEKVLKMFSIIPDEAGHSGDDRHAAIEHSILSELDGKPRLTLVETTNQDTNRD